MTRRHVTLHTLVGNGGRARRQDLLQFATDHSEQVFVELLRKPLLMGLGVQAGEIDALDEHHTKVFQQNEVSGKKRPDDPLKDTILPLVNLLRGNNRPKGFFSLGRSNDNDLVLPDYTISGHHAQIHVQSNHYSIVDGGSTNGTFINERRLEPEEKAQLSEEDIIRFGRYHFVMRSPSRLYAILLNLNLEKPIEAFINQLGRADYAALRKYAMAHDEHIFTQLIRHPSLMGSGLFRGTTQTPDGTVGMSTGIFRAEQHQENIKPTELSLFKRMVYPFVKAEHATSPADCFNLGRSEENDFCLPDSTISGHHAVITVEEDQTTYRIEDQNSQNGTAINGMVLESGESKTLREGDKLRLGRFQFTFLYPSSLYAKLMGMG
ncbi:MAG: FHA domain-containing protein [Magnetococcales bacterium]|nr:FHA domain-containing protein [Magnetococcales bacterium]